MAIVEPSRSESPRAAPPDASRRRGSDRFPDDDLELDAGEDIDREIAALGEACGRLAEGRRGAQGALSVASGSPLRMQIASSGEVRSGSDSRFQIALARCSSCRLQDTTSCFWSSGPDG